MDQIVASFVGALTGGIFSLVGIWLNQKLSRAGTPPSDGTREPASITTDQNDVTRHQKLVPASSTRVARRFKRSLFLCTTLLLIFFVFSLDECIYWDYLTTAKCSSPIGVRGESNWSILGWLLFIYMLISVVYVIYATVTGFVSILRTYYNSR